MVIYGLGPLLLIRHLKQKYPDTLQPWYVDDAAAAGKLSNLTKLFETLL